MTPIPIDRVTPGVWEVRHERWSPVIVRVHMIELAMMAEGTNGQDGTVREWINAGWTFTRRYVLCDGEPVIVYAVVRECDGVHISFSTRRGAAEVVSQGHPLSTRVVRGLFIPVGEKGVYSP